MGDEISIATIAAAEGVAPVDIDGPVVAVQGLGFVGAAMAVAVATSTEASGAPRYQVVGVDLDDPAGRSRIDALNAGTFPFETSDTSLVAALSAARERGSLICCDDERAYGLADVVVIDVPLDIDWRSADPELRLDGFTGAIRAVGRNVTAGTLVIVETTVPPGTTEHVVVPTLAEELTARGIDPREVLVAHSYERVMPGADYFDSIVNFWRVFAGHDEAAADATEAFLRTVINTEAFPLTRLSHTTASETAKVLENTYRATTIALMEEWARFAELAGIDLFEIVDAIRVRPTHANIRTPGFGVGGYCLTKDPLFARLGARAFFDADLEFSFSAAAVATNKDAPLASLDRLQTMMGGTLADRRILLLGISYRQDVGDTRYSPSETFVRAARARGASVEAYDPLVRHWDELDCDTPATLPASDGFDAVVFAVPHDEFRSLDLQAWLGGNRPTLLDAFGVLGPDQRDAALAHGCVVAAIGRGDTPS